jgi:hypothetical protein
MHKAFPPSGGFVTFHPPPLDFLHGIIQVMSVENRPGIEVSLCLAYGQAVAAFQDCQTYRVSNQTLRSFAGKDPWANAR